MARRRGYEAAQRARNQRPSAVYTLKGLRAAQRAALAEKRPLAAQAYGLWIDDMLAGRRAG